MAHTLPSSLHRRRNPAADPGGFTLVELLVVIGIIGILIGILIPVVGKIWGAAYEANTRNEISQISSACQRYYDDFRAYPGPMSNSDIDNQTSGDNPCDTANGSSFTVINCQTKSPVTGQTMFFTASQNLVLGLLGGLWVNTTGSGPAGLQYVDGPSSAQPNVPQTLIGTGPRSLGYSASNPNGNKQYTAYLPVQFPGSNLMLNGDGSPEGTWFTVNQGGPTTPLMGTAPFQTIGGRTFFDFIIPVFTDQYPDHMPILYMRARVGAKGIISGPITGIGASPNIATGPVQDPTTNANAYYNYDIRELQPYTLSSIPGAVSSQGVGVSKTLGGIIGYPYPMQQHGLQGVGQNLYYPTPTQSIVQQAASGTPPWNLPVPTNTIDNAGEYFLNQSIQPGNTSTSQYINATGSPRGKDSFVLISAGPDRTYGTADDLTSFGDVEP